MNIYDVAEKACLSIATVSRVINNKGNVTEKSRQKVMKAINELNYVPNALAIGLSTNTQRTVSIIVRDIANIHAGTAVNRLESNLNKLNYNIILYCTGDESGAKERYIRESLSKKVDAIILVGSLLAEAAENARMELFAAQTPILMINGATNIENAYCVVSDEYTGVKEIVRQYVRRGKRNILYIYDVPTYSGKNKIKGYRDALEELNLPARPELIVNCRQTLQSAYESVTKALNSLSFDSIIASEDLLAVGAVKALLEHGKSIPNDVFVTGINNSIISECCIPPITSLDNKILQLCDLATESLLTLFGKKRIPKIQTISTKIIYKETFTKE